MRFKPTEPKPYGLVQDSTKNDRTDKYREEHERIFGTDRKTKLGFCMIIYRDGKRHEINSQQELDEFEDSTGKIKMRKIEI